MRLFEFSRSATSPDVLRAAVEDRTAGAYCAFEGWVRDHNEGRQVVRLEYEA